uniref:Uncharacterized protein n=1 Tax=Oryza meridionalis TaxID=40149 RepID=A0A0E0ELL4_9ORYZ
MHETETLRLQHACTHDVDIVRPSILIGGGRGGEEAGAAIPAAQLLQRRGGTTARRRLVGCTTSDTEAEPKPEAHRRHHAPRPYLAVGGVLINPSTARTISPSTMTAMKNPKEGSGEPEPEKRAGVRSHARSMRRSLEEPEMDAEGQCLLYIPTPITEGNARVVEDERRSMYSAEREAEGAVNGHNKRHIYLLPLFDQAASVAEDTSICCQNLSLVELKTCLQAVVHIDLHLPRGINFPLGFPRLPTLIHSPRRASPTGTLAAKKVADFARL